MELIIVITALQCTSIAAFLYAIYLFNVSIRKLQLGNRLFIEKVNAECDLIRSSLHSTIKEAYANQLRSSSDTTGQSLDSITKKLDSIIEVQKARKGCSGKKVTSTSGKKEPAQSK